jgi:hypothetical protein
VQWTFFLSTSSTQPAFFQGDRLVRALRELLSIAAYNMAPSPQQRLNCQ